MSWNFAQIEGVDCSLATANEWRVRAACFCHFVRNSCNADVLCIAQDGRRGDDRPRSSKTAAAAQSHVGTRPGSSLLARLERAETRGSQRSAAPAAKLELALHPKQRHRHSIHSSSPQNRPHTYPSPFHLPPCLPRPSTPPPSKPTATQQPASKPPPPVLSPFPHPDLPQRRRAL